LGEQPPDFVEETHVGRRHGPGSAPDGGLIHLINARTDSAPERARPGADLAAGRFRVPNFARSAGSRQSRKSVLLPEPLTPVRQIKRLRGKATVRFFKLFAVAPRSQSRGVRASTGRRRASGGIRLARAQTAGRDGILVFHQLPQRAAGHHRAAVRSRARTEVQ